MTASLLRALIRAPASRVGEALWWEFEAPVESGAAATVAEVPGLLARVEEAREAGLWAVGFVSYEAAPAFDAALCALPPLAGRPVAAFGFFRPPRTVSLDRSEAGPARVENPAPAMDAATHAAAVAAVRQAIARGETYQVNLTFPVVGRLTGGVEALFHRLAPGSGADYAAFLDLGDEAVVSLSPELFFELEGARIAMRPMKGTRRRGRFDDEDDARAHELRESAKDRAENLMIVDMARNDLGRIAAAGSVRVASLCALERYPTVWQMTSRVEAETVAGLGEIFAALFPCASVTGAPKPAATRFIADLEPSPRGIYCGAIGWASPAAESRARFSVAIRTATVDRASGVASYGVGSGIVWDSDPAAEYDECLAKAMAIEDPGAPLGLFETMRWSPGRGVRLLDRHLARLASSARYWGLGSGLDEAEARALLSAAIAALPRQVHRVRLELDPEGRLGVACSPLGATSRCCVAVLATQPVASASPLLFHKTTHRAVYENASAVAAAAGAEEAILWNERGEITEGTKSNVLIRLGGRWLTPMRGCGLLAGVMRAHLLDRGFATEAVLSRAQLRGAESIIVVSALRGIRPVRLLSPLTE